MFDEAMQKLILILLLISSKILLCLSQEIWEDPYFKDPENDEITFLLSPETGGVILRMDEEIPPNITIAYLTFSGLNTPTISTFLEGTNDLLGSVFQQGDDGSWAVVVTNQIDYELMTSSRFVFDITIGGKTNTVYLTINNIDDNPPVIIPPSETCEIEENSIVTSDCFYTIQDADGWLPLMKFDISGPRGEENLFHFDYVEEVTSNLTKSAQTVLSTIQPLNYQSVSVHIFTWTVTDSGNHAVPQTVVVNVKDLRDTNPMWSSIFVSQTFDEKTAKSFQVIAYDGDVGINADIVYFLDGLSWSEFEEITIDTETGEINVAGINRDYYDEEIYNFQVVAQVVDLPDYSTAQYVTFIVNDVNDNSPEFYSPETRSVHFTFPEATFASLDDEDQVIAIRDIDTGDNARFTVSLRDEPLDKYNEPFQIQPTSGYRDMTFTLFITDSASLDYEDEDWRSFQFEIFVEETMNSSHTDSITVLIDLINWNDELPIFELEEYEAEVLETIGINQPVITVHADDRDIGDSIEYSLVGASTQRILRIDELTGEITTAIEGAFDYERQTEVTVQVAAKDTFHDSLGTPLHTTFVQLTITVLDVNDETPVISVMSLINVDENRDDGEVVQSNITASDADSTADLLFSFDWESSFATKNGGRVEFEEFKGCIVVDTIDISETSSGYVRAELKINELVPGNTPDYEVFDTLYLQLLVTDRNQEVGEGTASVQLTINIQDLNDNAPVFTDESISANNSVTEGASVGTLIGTVVATDADGPQFNQVTYSLAEEDDTPPGLIQINQNTGLLSVASDGIDADDPPTWYLNYTVMASDTDWITNATIRIFIIDVNDNSPIIEEYPETQEVEEQSPTGTEVLQIIANDKDRDAPFNEIWYQFTGSSTAEFRNVFSIDQNTGLITVDLKADNELDRDFGTREYPMLFGAYDNYENTGGIQNSNTGELLIVLTDINNRIPYITNSSLTLSESLKAGADVEAVLLAHDDDEENTDNTKIDFTIMEILSDDGPLDEDLFSISTDENFETGVAQLHVLKDLEGFYGSYSFIIQTNDFGTNPGRNYFNNTLELTIEKYNFHAPVFIYPQDQERVFLAKSNSMHSQLYLYNGDRLSAIQADDMQGNKWDISFSIEGDDASLQIFTIDNSPMHGQSTGMLQLANTPNWDTPYTLTIVANDEGNPPFTSSVVLNVRFYDLDSLPFFPEDSRVLEVQFTENTTGLEETATIPKASYNGEEDWDFPIYYLLLEGDGDLFTVDASSGDITLVSMLDREEVDSYVLKILASNSESKPSEYTDESVLTVLVEVLDVNDNPPHFEQTVFTAGISTSNSVQDMVLRLNAYDLDSSDVLTFYIEEDSLSATGNAIEGLSNPFILEENTGIVFLNFRVQSNMDGYFSFVAVVRDSPPENHEDKSEVQVYIIGDQYRIQFTFENTLDTVNNLSDVVQSVLQEQFNYSCNVETILRDTDENGNTIDSQTVVTVHFINNEHNEPVNRTEIESSLTDITFYAALRAEFLQYTLLLMSFQRSVTDTPTDDNLVVWFIGVTTALVLFCFIVITLFILKLRSLNNRLTKLTPTKIGSQESGMNQLGVAAPNTNRRIKAGSNPVYNEEKKMPDIDDVSIYSGDSDLIGVEDNPEFEMTTPNYDAKNITKC